MKASLKPGNNAGNRPPRPLSPSSSTPRGILGTLGAVRWPNSIFLVGTLLVTVTAVPLFIWRHGLGWFDVALFAVFFAATGLSITMGYHRLFSHLSFQAGWPVRLGTLLFGAAAFENSVLCWAADHRRHHKFVDQEDDPYDITKGFFHAHIGWILMKAQEETSFDWVKDLQRDRLVVWQHRYYVLIALLVGFGLPALLGGLHGGWTGALGGFLIAGVARTVLVNHMTFFINSWSHTWGRRPYSSQFTARDNAVLALLTFGEGYHNFHHAFQHDYRNGVKPWQFDPTKWCIWLLHKAGLAWQLRRVPEGKIVLAELAEQQRQVAEKLKAKPVSAAEAISQRLHAAQLQVQHAFARWEQRKEEYRRAMAMRRQISRERLRQLRREFREAALHARAAIRQWREVRRCALALAS